MRRGWAAGLALIAVSCGTAEASQSEREPLEVAGYPEPWPSSIDGDIYQVFPCDQVQDAGQWAVDIWPTDVPDGWTVEVSCDLRGDYIGWYTSSDRMLTLYPQASGDPDRLLWTVGHEYGHALDHGDDRTHREPWAAWRGYDPDPWCGQDEHGSDVHHPCGEWAETYAACVTGWDRWRSDLAPAPGPLDCAVMGALVGR